MRLSIFLKRKKNQNVHSFVTTCTRKGLCSLNEGRQKDARKKTCEHRKKYHHPFTFLHTSTPCLLEPQTYNIQYNSKCITTLHTTTWNKIRSPFFSQDTSYQIRSHPNMLFTNCYFNM